MYTDISFVLFFGFDYYLYKGWSKSNAKHKFALLFGAVIYKRK